MYRCVYVFLYKSAPLGKKPPLVNSLSRKPLDSWSIPLKKLNMPRSSDSWKGYIFLLLTRIYFGHVPDHGIISPVSSSSSCSSSLPAASVISAISAAESFNELLDKVVLVVMGSDDDDGDDRRNDMYPRSLAPGRYSIRLDTSCSWRRTDRRIVSFDSVWTHCTLFSSRSFSTLCWVDVKLQKGCNESLIRIWTKW